MALPPYVNWRPLVRMKPVLGVIGLLGAAAVRSLPIVVGPAQFVCKLVLCLRFDARELEDQHRNIQARLHDC